MTALTSAGSTEVSARSKARKRALDILFEAEQRGVNAEALLAQRIEKPVTEHALSDYSVEIVRGVVDKWTPINELLASYSHLRDVDGAGWTHGFATLVRSCKAAARSVPNAPPARAEPAEAALAG